ncbi:hemicentin-1-like isoform X2 [Denticeps clupeoides]|uniref:hemicentin-1-like isoform X2 n=1 Tax=Denticeps clupeoides TaxID=299321 RepID=UPI0010A36F22|nr:intercellular adhesion molecule 3 isoform X2 [Denticeps clupeoides]
MFAETSLRLSLLLLAVRVADATCSLKISPSRLVVRFGDPASANCSTNMGSEGMGWESPVGGQGITEGVQWLTWRVRKLEKWDIQPMCFLSTDGNQCHEVLILTVYKDLDSIPDLWTNHTGPMVEDGWYHLFCDIESVAPAEDLVVKWYKGDTVVREETFEKILEKSPVNVTSTLVIRPDRDDDGRRYRCEAELRLGEEGPQPPPRVESRPLGITVHYGPVVENCPSHVDVSEGTSLQEYCTVAGNPPPNYYWQKNGRPIDHTLPLNKTDSGRYNLFVDGLTSTSRTLQVSVTCNPEPIMFWVKDGEDVILPARLTRNDGGHYIVYVNNSHSNVTHTIHIDVQYPPSPIAELEDSDVNVGSAAVLKCSSSGNPPPQYRWRYLRADNVEVKDEDKVSLLYINNATAENIGRYTCSAQNELGEVSASAVVSVNGSSDAKCFLKINPSRLVVRYGDSASANCSTDVETSGMGWESPVSGQSLTEGVQLLTWHVGRLDKWDIQPLCFSIPVHADQCMESLSLTVYKDLDSIPDLWTNHTGPMVEDGRYHLFCDIESVAPAEDLVVKWYKGDTVVKEETFEKILEKSPVNVTSTLVIRPDRDDDGRRYRCEAELHLGEEGPQPPPRVESHPLGITVHYPPSAVTGLEDTHVDVGSTVVLKCSASGNPPPQYRWSYHRAANVEVKEQGGASRLYLNGALGENTGTYICFVQNELGQVSGSARVTVNGAEAACPLELEPSELVVEYGKAVSVTCWARGAHAEISWRVSGRRIPHGTWGSDALRDWDVRPECVGDFEGLDPCTKYLDITVYKKPDAVTIGLVSHSGPVVAGKKYQLQCTVENVAPVQNLTVKWYREEDGATRAMKNETFSDSSRMPTSVSSILELIPSRNDNGCTYWCVAEQAFASMRKDPIETRSDLLSIVVHYAPIIKDSFPTKMPVFRDYAELLFCEAEGNPEPEVIWTFSNKSLGVGNITVTSENVGVYTCTAKNIVATTTKEVHIIFKEDYLPLIAGFVAVIVVVISVIFVFIYSIYYKNTKMGHYSLKNAKPNTQNGNVAQNGQDSGFPMKKLSQQNILA